MDKNTALQNIESLRLPELQALFAEVTGETTKAPNKKYLIRRIRETLAEQAAEVIEEEQAIERMAERAAPASAEPSAEEDAAPAKPKKAKRTRRGARKAASTDATPSTDTGVTSSDAEPTEPTDAEPTSTEGSEPTSTEGPEDATNVQDAPADEELGAAAAADMADAAAESATQDADDGKPLRELTVAELQARYLEVVGRPTSSSHRRYLIWKIREAQKGRVPVGPRNRRAPGEPAPDFQILPVRMEADLVKRLDDARERLGLKSRMNLFRKALAAYLDSAGETALAAAISPNT